MSHSLNTFPCIREPVCFVWFIVSLHPWPAYSGGVRECFWSLKKGEKAEGSGWMRSWGALSSLLVKNYCFAEEYKGMQESAMGRRSNQVSLCRSQEDIGLKLLLSAAQDLIPLRKCYSLGIFVVQSLSHVWLCDPMNCSMPAFPVLHCLWRLLKLMSSESMMPSNHLLLSHRLLLLPSIFPSGGKDFQSLFQWVSSLYQVTKVLELQHQSFQWISHVHWVDDGIQPSHPRASCILVLFFSSRNIEFGLWSWSFLWLGQVFMVWNTLPRAGIVSVLSSSWFAGRQYMTVVGWWPCARYSHRGRVTLREFICFREFYLFVQEGLHRSSSWSHRICQQEQVRRFPVCEPICGNA